jgi:hypothetical protein
MQDGAEAIKIVRGCPGIIIISNANVKLRKTKSPTWQGKKLKP